MAGNETGKYAFIVSAVFLAGAVSVAAAEKFGDSGDNPKPVPNHETVCEGVDEVLYDIGTDGKNDMGTTTDLMAGDLNAMFHLKDPITAKQVAERNTRVFDRAGVAKKVGPTCIAMGREYISVAQAHKGELISFYH